MSHRALPTLVFLVPCLLAPGCAEEPFSVHAEDNDLKSLKLALGRMPATLPAAPRNSSGHAMVYVFAGPERREGKNTGGAERTLYGYDLTAGQLAFAVPADVRSRFAVGKNVLAHREGEDTLALRDVRSGQLHARVPLEPGRLFIGLCADDDRVYYVTLGKKEGQRQSYVTAVQPDGQKAWSVPAPGSVGAPVARGGVLALPYRYQDVVLLDGRTGAELSRVRQKDEGIGFVREDAHGIYYGVGDRGVGLLDERSVKGVKEEIAYLAPNLGEKVRVFLHWDGYRPEQADFSAFDRNRVLWTGARKDGGLAFQDDLAILHSYRFFFAVDAGGGQIRWAYAQPRQNIMASDKTERAVVFAVQDGEIGALDPQTGAKVASHRLPLKPGQQVLGATFDAAGFAPAEKGRPAPVLQVLDGIIFDKDSSFIAVKTFAVQAVNSIKSKEATAELLKVVTAEAMPAQVTRAAGEALVARRDRDVAQMLVEALGTRYDYLADRHPKGIGVLARAAAALGLKEAAPALSEQLWDASAPPAVLKELVTSLVKIGGKDAIRPLRELVLLYRSDPMFQNDAEALKLAGAGLLKLGGEAERRTIYYIAEEPRTIAPLASYYRKILDETAVKVSTKVKAQEESPEAAPQR